MSKPINGVCQQKPVLCSLAFEPECGLPPWAAAWATLSRSPFFGDARASERLALVRGLVDAESAVAFVCASSKVVGQLDAGRRVSVAEPWPQASLSMAYVVRRHAAVRGVGSELPFDQATSMPMVAWAEMAPSDA